MASSTTYAIAFPIVGFVMVVLLLCLWLRMRRQGAREAEGPRGLKEAGEVGAPPEPPVPPTVMREVTPDAYVPPQHVTPALEPTYTAGDERVGLKIKQHESGFGRLVDFGARGTLTLRFADGDDLRLLPTQVEFWMPSNQIYDAELTDRAPQELLSLGCAVKIQGVTDAGAFLVTFPDIPSFGMYELRAEQLRLLLSPPPGVDRARNFDVGAGSQYSPVSSATPSRPGYPHDEVIEAAAARVPSMMPPNTHLRPLHNETNALLTSPPRPLVLDPPPGSPYAEARQSQRVYSYATPLSQQRRPRFFV